MENKLTYLEPELEKQLKGHKNAITALFFNPNELQIASSSLDNSVLLWDLRGTMRSYRFQGHDEAVMDVTFSPSGKYMASASRDKTVRLWVPTVTGSTGMFKAHSQTVRSVQFNYDGSKIVTASDDKIVKLWSTEKHKFIASFVGHTNWVRCARMSTDGAVIASCSDDKTTRLWNPESGDCVHTYKDQKGHSLCLAWHPSGCYVAVGTSHGNVKLYDVRTHTLVQYYSIHDDAVTQLAFHPSGSYIITASKDGKMKILDLLEGHPIFTLSGHTGSINAVNFSVSGETFASAGDDKLVFIWKTNFTELVNDNQKENIPQSISSLPKSASQTSTRRGKTQGIRTWSACYHSTRLPVTNFVHLDDVCESTNDTPNFASFVEDPPNGNSTMIDAQMYSRIDPMRQRFILNNSIQEVHDRLSTQDLNFENPISGSHSHDVGHISHIPRAPPTQATFTIPSLTNRSIHTTQYDHADSLFGMIKLQGNDVCYTSGTIEWVGRKRSYPINSGFKVIDHNEDAQHKKLRKLNKTFTNQVDKLKECDCADVLPTVNAIVDHLNALHEAVDLVDLRLNTIEDAHS